MTEEALEARIQHSASTVEYWIEYAMLAARECRIYAGLLPSPYEGWRMRLSFARLRVIEDKMLQKMDVPFPSKIRSERSRLLGGFGSETVLRHLRVLERLIEYYHAGKEAGQWNETP